MSFIELMVLGNGAFLQPSVVIRTANNAYLFNCGEGTQRMLIEHKHVRMTKFQDIFFTSPIYENWSGFFGLSLSFKNFTTNLNFYGSSKFQNIKALYKPFLNSGINLNHIITDQTKDEISKNLLDNSNLSIKSISCQQSTTYILLIKDKPGKLLIEKCKELQISPGPIYSALKRGETVKIEDRIIEPKEVLGPAEIGNAVVILECHSIDNLTNFLSQFQDFSQYLDGKELELIVHLTPKEVIDDQRYQQWIRNFDSKVGHLLLNQNNRFELGYIKSTELQVKLNLLDNQIFKLLNEKQLKYCYKDKNGSTSIMIDNCPNLLTYRIRPRCDQNKIHILNLNCCEINSEEICNEFMQEPNFLERLNWYRNEINKSQFSSKTFPNILFLGTASSMPGRQRNTSSIMINLEDKKSILFDCGENTFLQMNRFFGRHEVHKILACISAIFISHFHADHHFGLIKLIKERSKIKTIKEPLLIIAPSLILDFLSDFDTTVENLSSHYQTIACKDILFQETKLDHIQQKKLLNKLSLEDLVTVNVPHCLESFGIVITYKGRKIAYSGDSMYSDAFDEVGKECDLMIHEATMNDDLIEEAYLKKHSTISEAIKVGQKIGAKFLILTHFSQRYANIAPINFIEDKSLAFYIQDRVALSFDFMQIPLDDLWKAAKLKYPLEIMFDEALQKIQDKIVKKNSKRKLLENNNLP